MYRVKFGMSFDQIAPPGPKMAMSWGSCVLHRLIIGKTLIEL